MKINLQKTFFANKSELLTYGSFKIAAFSYPSGVEALEVSNSRLSFIFTPFKGQQIWHLKVDGEEISMKTEVTEPQSTMTYLENYGGFMYHCGVISFGAPDESHSQHGEIPNAIYDSAYVGCGEDEGGKYITLGGSLLHNTAFVRKYRFSPEIKLYEDATVFKISVKLENLRAYPLEYMYLCHINFRPFENAKLIASAKCDREHVKIYKTVGFQSLGDYFAKLEENLEVMNTVSRGSQCYDPEICFGIVYESDESGRAYTLQDTANGACYVSHPTEVLPYSIRWISRTENEDAMGMCLPATGEHLGYKNAKDKGQIKILPPNSELVFEIEAGWLDKPCAEEVKSRIAKILEK
ncbi:MAG: DUF4432 family protein [Ruminococcaceae bacterium]|nr:DUF4432 family protein [Oscillospiraceae bacterium]